MGEALKNEGETRFGASGPECPLSFEKLKIVIFRVLKE
jgi:hypothetical protein